MRHRTAAGRRDHHAKQRVRKQRYRAWEAEYASFLEGLGADRATRKQMYRFRHIARPIVRRCFDGELMREMFGVEVRIAQDAMVSTAGA
jgi:hypothetical protein